MRKILGLLIFAGLAQVAFSQSNPTTGKKESSPNSQVIEQPKTVNDPLSLKELVHDFGKIIQGKPVTYVFELTNTGSTPFALESVHASCGCTTPEWSSEPIAPGATSKVTVGYNAAAVGVFDRSITLVYDGNKTKELHIKGEVWKAPENPAPENKKLKSLKNE